MISKWPFLLEITKFVVSAKVVNKLCCCCSWFLSVASSFLSAASSFLFHLVKETCFKRIPVCLFNGKKVCKIFIAFNDAENRIRVCLHKNISIVIFIRLNIKEFIFCFYVKNSFSFSDNIKLDCDMFIASDSFLCCCCSFFTISSYVIFYFFLLSCIVPRCGLRYASMTINICQKVIKFYKGN